MFRITEAHGDLDTVTRLYHEAVTMANATGSVGTTHSVSDWIPALGSQHTIASVTIERVK